MSSYLFRTVPFSLSDYFLETPLHESVSILFHNEKIINEPENLIYPAFSLQI